MDGMLIGYARCSTRGQDLRAQEYELRKVGVAPDRIYTDSGFTGRNTNQPGLKTALEVVREGDTLIVTKLDRLGRSILDLHNIANELTEKGVKLSWGGQHDASSGRAARYVFVVRGKLLSNVTLFDLSLKAACTAAGLVDSRGRQTITPHRFRHTIGTQLAEGGARLQTIMAVLGHKSPNMSIVYSTLSDPTVKQQYQDIITARPGLDVTLAGPAAEALREHRLAPEAVSWLQTNFLKTELELGHCLRLPAEGPCECDLMLTCSKFLTTSDYAPRLRTRLATEHQLMEDAQARGWDREAERHQRTAYRVEALLDELGDRPTIDVPECRRVEETG